MNDDDEFFYIVLFLAAFFSFAVSLYFALD